jgi:hypothetical protein
MPSPAPDLELLQHTTAQLQAQSLMQTLAIAALMQGHPNPQAVLARFALAAEQAIDRGTQLGFDDSLPPAIARKQHDLLRAAYDTLAELLRRSAATPGR